MTARPIFCLSAFQVRFPSFMSDVARSLLSGLLVKDPARRLGGGPEGAAEIKNHAFFASINWKDLQDRKVRQPAAANPTPPIKLNGPAFGGRPHKI